MHILLITHYYSPEVGAPQRRWSALVQRWVADGHQVTVLCPSPHYPDKKSTRSLRTSYNRPLRKTHGKDGEVILWMPYLLHGYSSIPRFADQLTTAAVSAVTGVLSSKRRYNVVVSTTPGLPSLFAGIIVSKLLKIPHIAEIRDAWPDIVTGNLDDQIAPISPIKRVVKKAIYSAVTAGQHSADALVATTPRFVSKLRERGMKRVIFIPNGADITEFSGIKPLKESFMKERGRDELRVQYLGTVGRSQGLITFINALEIIKMRSPEINISSRVIGSGADLEYLKEQSHRRGLKIDFRGPISREELRAAYEWADVELVSLRKTRPFQWTIPSKIFELLSTRRFIVALVDGSAADLIYSSGAGSVIEPENALALAEELESLAKSPERLCVGNSGIELLKDFYSYDLMSDKYESLIKAVLQEHTSHV